MLFVKYFFFSSTLNIDIQYIVDIGECIEHPDLLSCLMAAIKYLGHIDNIFVIQTLQDMYQDTGIVRVQYFTVHVLQRTIDWGSSSNFKINQ